MESHIEAPRHLEQIAELERVLQAIGVTLYEHHYHYLIFGSFELVVGKPHRRMKIVWDGKESCLTVERSKFPNQGAHPEWKHEQLLRISSDAVVETIEQVVRAEFAL
jgi:hypothetical protein